jgi:ABC-type maltose transport system permease subunit
MLLIHYYALALAGALLAGAWLFLPRTRLPVTTLGSLLVWFLLALLGGQTETLAQNETVRTVNNTTVAVASPEFVAAPVPPEFRYFAALLGLLSGFALILGVFWDAYPPQEDINE